jgi:hypothetical protein
MKVAVAHSFSSILKKLNPNRVDDPTAASSMRYRMPNLLSDELVPSIAQAAVECASREQIARQPVSDPDSYRGDVIRKLSLPR